jgi:hypothetical protein
MTRQADDAIHVGRWADAALAAAGALDLWRGTPLADVPSRLLQDQWVPVLEQLHVQALACRIEAWRPSWASIPVRSCAVCTSTSLRGTPA